MTRCPLCNGPLLPSVISLYDTSIDSIPTEVCARSSCGAHVFEGEIIQGPGLDALKDPAPEILLVRAKALTLLSERLILEAKFKILEAEKVQELIKAIVSKSKQDQEKRLS